LFSLLYLPTQGIITTEDPFSGQASVPLGTSPFPLYFFLTRPRELFGGRFRLPFFLAGFKSYFANRYPRGIRESSNPLFSCRHISLLVVFSFRPKTPKPFRPIGFFIFQLSVLSPPVRGFFFPFISGTWTATPPPS